MRFCPYIGFGGRNRAKGDEIFSDTYFERMICIMEIKKEKNGSALTLILIGKLSIMEANDLGKVVDDELADVTDLTFDLKDLTYVSSAGLRVLLTAQNIMDDAGGEMKLIHVSPFIKDVLKLTGFNKFMTIED